MIDEENVCIEWTDQFGSARKLRLRAIKGGETILDLYARDPYDDDQKSDAVQYTDILFSNLTQKAAVELVEYLTARYEL